MLLFSVYHTTFCCVLYYARSGNGHTHTTKLPHKITKPLNQESQVTPVERRHRVRQSDLAIPGVKVRHGLQVLLQVLFASLHSLCC